MKLWITAVVCEGSTHLHSLPTNISSEGGCLLFNEVWMWVEWCPAPFGCKPWVVHLCRTINFRCTRCVCVAVESIDMHIWTLEIKASREFLFSRFCEEGHRLGLLYCIHAGSVSCVSLLLKTGHSNISTFHYLTCHNRLLPINHTGLRLKTK